MPDSTETFKLRYFRSPHFRVVSPDGFNFQHLVLSGGETVILTATLDSIQIESEEFEAEVKSQGVKQIGERKFIQYPVKIEEVSLRLTPKVAVDLTRVLVRNLPSFSPTSVNSVKAELEKLQSKES